MTRAVEDGATVKIYYENRIIKLDTNEDIIEEIDEKEQKEFKQFAIELGKAHALCAATDEGKRVALEVSYFKAVKASLTKLDSKTIVKKSKKALETVMRQAELMCGNVDVEDLTVAMVAEESGEYRV